MNPVLEGMILGVVWGISVTLAYAAYMRGKDTETWGRLITQWKGLSNDWKGLYEQEKALTGFWKMSFEKLEKTNATQRSRPDGAKVLPEVQADSAPLAGGPACHLPKH